MKTLRSCGIRLALAAAFLPLVAGSPSSLSGPPSPHSSGLSPRAAKGRKPLAGRGDGAPDCDEEKTGLVIRCNTYHNNSYDEMVTRESEGGNEGIAPDQGSPEPVTARDLAGNEFSPCHESAQFPETDILNEGEFINYYHHIQGQQSTDPRYQPDFYTSNTILPQEKPKLYDTTCCPSKLEPGGSEEEIKEEMASASDSCLLVESELISMIDGGNTTELNDEVLFSAPPDVVDLHQVLLALSPYLSDTVMQSAVEKEDVLPNAVIRDVLVANPQAAKSESVLQGVENRFEPMPETMMQEILEGKLQVSPKEVLEGKLSSHKAHRQSLFNDLIKQYKQDTINPWASDSLKALLQTYPSCGARYHLAFEYLASGDTTQVFDVLNEIPIAFSLSNARQNDFVDYFDYLQLLTTVSGQGRSIYELSEEELNLIHEWRIDACEPVKSRSRNILLANNQFDYSETILLPDLTKSTPIEHGRKGVRKVSKDYFSLYPNPAEQFFILDYQVADFPSHELDVLIVITNQSGYAVWQTRKQTNQDQVFINTTTFRPGGYLCTLSVDGKVLQNKKFVVFR